MAKKTKYSNAGKGDKSRVKDKKKYDKNYDRIFKPKMSDFPIPTTKVFKSKKRKSRQQEKIDLKKEIAWLIYIFFCIFGGNKELKNE